MHKIIFFNLFESIYSPRLWAGKTTEKGNWKLKKAAVSGEQGQRSTVAHSREGVAWDLITCLCAWTWLLGVRNSPEERAAKRRYFTDCQFGGNDPALWIRVLGKDKVVYWEIISCTGNPHCTEGKKGHGVYHTSIQGGGKREEDEVGER